MNKQRRKRLADAVAKLNELHSALDDVRSEVESIRDEEVEAFDNLPESLQQGDNAETKDAVSDGFDQLDSAVGDLSSAAEQLGTVC